MLSTDYAVRSNLLKEQIKLFTKAILNNKYFKAISVLSYCRENFTVKEVQGMMNQMFFFDLDKFVDGMICGAVCGQMDCGQCCGEAGLCFACLFLDAYVCNCIPGCDKVSEFCVHLACSPCHWCITQTGCGSFCLISMCEKM